MKKMFYFNNQKGKIKIKQKYLFLYFELIIVLLKIVFADLINSKNTRKSKNYYSEIHLVIQKDNFFSLPISILNDEFDTDPDEVLINGNLKECKKKCNLQYGRNNITLRFKNQIESCEKMFRYLNNIIEVDLSKIDASKITTMSKMFSGCSSLEKINFGNINTSSVENMEYLFYGCSKLTTIDLSKFDTSNVKTMEAMFCYCDKLKYLDLSNFNTQKVTTINSMFYYCDSLIFLNLKNFQINSTVDKTDAFDEISGNVKYCIKDENTRNYLLPDEYFLCNDICFNENIKIDIKNNKCIETCSGQKYYGSYYKYEYNNICYFECPTDTYPLFCNGNECNDIRECFDKTPENYYLDINYNVNIVLDMEMRQIIIVKNVKEIIHF